MSQVNDTDYDKLIAYLKDDTIQKSTKLVLMILNEIQLDNEWVDANDIRQEFSRYSKNKRPTDISQFWSQAFTHPNKIETHKTLGKFIEFKPKEPEPGTHKTHYRITNGLRDVVSNAINQYLGNRSIDDYANGDNMVSSVTNGNLNTILYGPPGTGKTYAVIERALKILGVWKNEYAEDRKKAVEIFNDFQKQGRIEFTTFHQSYSYEEFIEGIKPEKDDSGISYPVKDGVFKRIALKAQGKDFTSFDDAIEELKKACDESEGNSLTIKTDSSSFTVTYRGGKTFKVRPSNSSKPDQDYHASIENIKKLYFSEVTKKEVYNPTYVTEILNKLYEYGLPRKHSQQSNNARTNGSSKPNYIIVIDEINRGNISKIFGELITLIEDDKRIGCENETFITLPYSSEKSEKFGVPQNLYIIGTMNTADRSIALMDTALRRRFIFEEIMPDYDVIDFEIEGINIKQMLETINRRITYLYDRDHQIGHAYFIPLKKNPSIELLCEIFLNKIIPLLQEYFYDDWDKIQMVLGDHREQKKPEEYKLIISEEINQSELFSFSYSDEEHFSYSINEQLKNKEMPIDAFVKIYRENK